MAKRYAEAAVDALKDYLDANLVAWLRETEGLDADLSASELTDPVEIRKSPDIHDNRSPIVLVFDESGEQDHARLGVWKINCVIAVAYIGGTDTGYNEFFMRSYLSAIEDCLRADLTLGSLVTGVQINGYDRGEFGDDSATRTFLSIDADILVCEDAVALTP